MTLVTDCTIINTAESLNLEVYVLGQGDNQVIVIKWSPYQIDHRKELRTQFSSILSENILNNNMLLKASETWACSPLVEYSNNRWLSGTAVSNDTKRAA